MSSGEGEPGGELRFWGLLRMRSSWASELGGDWGGERLPCPDWGPEGIGGTASGRACMWYSSSASSSSNPLCCRLPEGLRPSSIGPSCGEEGASGLLLPRR
eukprot:CAMPEP_0171282634 /NCGR_PEP_ID=MMETSP0790-20130122/67017_1 /TAXON_ID=2925 /ORGANISM="Alexandrium catenella, Strain OF101" /LENGTH=100 /DNA_ID=CAMNT_0011751891 /DNA_START=321 /DNA_END=620 /DNA_ORIENTATION=+